MRSGIGFAVMVLLAGLAGAPSALAKAAFTAVLSGAEQVPPLATDAGGHVVVVVTPGSTNHTLVVNDGVDVLAAHIHCAEAGVNGPVGVTLFFFLPSPGTPVTMNGVLSQGPWMPDAGNACGWTGADDVVDAIEAGGAYVNVHTVLNQSGEIRGQLH